MKKIRRHIIFATAQVFYLTAQKKNNRKNKYEKEKDANGVKYGNSRKLNIKNS